MKFFAKMLLASLVSVTLAQAAHAEPTSGSLTIAQCRGELHDAQEVGAAANGECPSVCGARDGTWTGASSSIAVVLSGQFGNLDGKSPGTPAAFLTCSCEISQQQAARRPACL